MSNQNFIRKMGTPKKGVLASEIAGRATDPNFISNLLQILPNPDAVLRKMGHLYQSQAVEEIYNAISYDAHVQGELRSIRGQLLQREYRLLPGGDLAIDIQAFELCEKIFNSKPAPGMQWNDVHWNMIGAIFRGYNAHEVIWRKEGNHLIPDQVLDRPQRRMVWNADNEMRLLTRSKPQEGEELDPYKWLVTRHMPSQVNPYGVAIFSAIFWPWTFKTNGFRWFARFIEKYGIPKAVGKYSVGTPESDIDALRDALANIIEDGVVAIPDSGAVSLLELKPMGHLPHRELLNFCNKEISKALTSQTLGTEVQDAGGNRALGEVHQEREGRGADADADMVRTTLQELCDFITWLNYPGACPPKWLWHEAEEITKDQVETVRQAAGVAPLKKSEVYERIGFTPPEEKDEVIFLGGQQAAPGEGNEFACPSCGTTHQFAGSPEEDIERLISQADELSEEAISAVIDQVYEFSGKYESLEEFEKNLRKLYKDLDSSAYERIIAQANMIARAEGIDNA